MGSPTVQLYFAPEDIEEEQGMYHISHHDQYHHSVYSNRVQDQRDIVIEQLKKKVDQPEQQTQLTRSHNNDGYTLFNNKGPQFQEDRNDSHNQSQSNEELEKLANLLVGKVLDQFANTQAGNTSSQNDDQGFHEV
jgi:hypothetical protein